MTRDELETIARRLDEWPAGLGYALVKAPERSRGWKRAPGYRAFAPPPPDTMT